MTDRHQEIQNSYKQLGNMASLYDGIITRSTVIGKIMDSVIWGHMQIHCRKTLAKVLKIPGMKGLFIRVWDPLTRKVFGPANGFKNTFYDNMKGEYRMDVVSCPYFRYFTELGCPELTRISCKSDDLVYGNLPGIRFERTGTLGRGNERCDFYIRKK